MGLAFWPLRKQMRLIRWGLVCALVGLHLVMKAPVWALIARIDLTGSSSGYQRYQLVDMCIRHFSDWWLLGTPNYVKWGWDSWDLCNQFVAVALTGGLLALIFYIAIFSRSFWSDWDGKETGGGGPQAGMASLVPGFGPVCHCGGAFRHQLYGSIDHGFLPPGGLHLRGNLRGQADRGRRSKAGPACICSGRRRDLMCRSAKQSKKPGTVFLRDENASRHS